MIYIKTQQEINGIKQACLIWKKVKQALIANCKPGVTTAWLDKIASKIIKQNNAIASFYQYNGFPSHICISINEQIIHGIASNYKLKAKDIVTFDVGVTYNNYTCDAAFSVVLDSKNKKANDINDATIDCLNQAILQVKPGNYTGDISYAIQQTAKKYGYHVIKNYGGHGCGLKIHEDPIILCYGKKTTGCLLRPGMTICIEPMLMSGSDEYFIDPTNQWTVIAKNKQLTCHHEHMVLVTKNGCEILTN